jgi:hypothetical protein
MEYVILWPLAICAAILALKWWFVDSANSGIKVKKYKIVNGYRVRDYAAEAELARRTKPTAQRRPQRADYRGPRCPPSHSHLTRKYAEQCSGTPSNQEEQQGDDLAPILDRMERRGVAWRDHVEREPGRGVTWSDLHRDDDR